MSQLAPDSATTPTAPPPTARLQSIDCLRGVAALAVVFLHAMAYGDPPPHVGWLQNLVAWAHFGGLGVTLFFLISGFCIHLRWAQRQASTGAARLEFSRFWKRRLHRLYPPYLVALCISMGLVSIALLFHRSVAVVESYPTPNARWLLLDFVAHVFMLHGFHPILDWGAGNPPFWTLAREEHLYLLYFPLLLWRRRIGLAASFLLVPAIGYLFPIVLNLALPPRPLYAYYLSSTVVLSSAPVLWYQ